MNELNKVNGNYLFIFLSFLFIILLLLLFFIPSVVKIRKVKNKVKNK